MPHAMLWPSPPARLPDCTRSGGAGYFSPPAAPANSPAMAVFTPVTPEEAQAFLEGFDLGRLVELQGVAEGVENSNFRLATTAGVFALTLFEKRVNPDDLPVYLGLMEHLAEHGAPAPGPRRQRSGALVGVLTSRAAAIVDWLPGQWLRVPTPGDQIKAGVALAGMHRAAEGFA